MAERWRIEMVQQVCLTVAGVDPSGGAGVLADVRVFSSFGVFPTAVISSVTFQNTKGVFGAVHQDADSVRRQLEAVFDDLGVSAVKTGMLPTDGVIRATADVFRDLKTDAIIVDPVVRSTSGFDLIDDAALRSLVRELFPQSLLVTPNVPEAERISGRSISSEKDVAAAAKAILDLGAKNVLIKGGHAIHIDARDARARDRLFMSNGEMMVFESELIKTTSTHGTGCVLSAAITANCALGHAVPDSIRIAKEFVTEAIRTAPGLGGGHGPLNIPARM